MLDAHRRAEVECLEHRVGGLLVLLELVVLGHEREPGAVLTAHVVTVPPRVRLVEQGVHPDAVLRPVGADRDVLRPARLRRKLAKIAGADYVLIAYSEWAVATGRFVPTSKALAKNVVSIYDSNGKQVYADRADTQGDKTLGALGSVVVDQNSIAEWVNAYDKGIHTLYGAAR